MIELEFEKVGDINTAFPYLCVYFKGEKEPFMDVGITGAGSIEYIFYPHPKNLILSSENWNAILLRAQIFLETELSNKKFEDEWDASV
ncbi:hypothetical protein ACI77I_24080 [Pseudomonas sp. D47]|uniref:hypothetical protein n=1 Tax=Pseudomonas sp. D47 TaxID=3159447 RepID=UPI00387B1CC6